MFSPQDLCTCSFLWLKCFPPLDILMIQSLFPFRLYGNVTFLVRPALISPPLLIHLHCFIFLHSVYHCFIQCLFLLFTFFNVCLPKEKVSSWRARIWACLVSCSFLEPRIVPPLDEHVLHFEGLCDGVRYRNSRALSLIVPCCASSDQL